MNNLYIWMWSLIKSEIACKAFVVKKEILFAQINQTNGTNWATGLNSGKVSITLTLD